MSGIAGGIDLEGQRLLPSDVLQRMAKSLRHRGPDGEAFWQNDGVSLACCMLGTGQFRDGEPVVAFDGHLVPSPLSPLPQGETGRGEGATSGRDAERIADTWNQHQVSFLNHLHGQFAFALFDRRARRIVLARDRFGICPLFFSQQGDWLLFASEIKPLFASGMVPIQPDRRGINHIMTFFALPGPITCFAGVSMLLHSHYLDIRLGDSPLTPHPSPPGEEGKGARGSIAARRYWDVDFPDKGQEERGGDPKPLVDGLERVLTRAVERQLDSDNVACYLSGGLDSSIVAALAGKVRGRPLPAYTIRIEDPRLDESHDAALIARHLGYEPVTVSCGVSETLAALPRLIAACESPVIDLACSSLLLMNERVHADGYKFALSGEGADEWTASLPWFKFHKALGMLDFIPGVPLSHYVRLLFLRLTGAPIFPREFRRRTQATIGGYSPWLDAYGLMSMSKLRFYNEPMRDLMLDHLPYADLNLDLERMKRWHPLHQALYLGTRVHLPGLLLPAKNDRPAMQSSVQPRFPFVDEEVCAYFGRLHPRWKLRRFRDKYLLRLLAERYLPQSVIWRSKALFRAPTNIFAVDKWPVFADQLLSAESLRRADYFDPAAVAHWRGAFAGLRPRSATRSSLEMGLAGVLTTQLWHHLFIDATLCELPGLQLGPD